MRSNNIKKRTSSETIEWLSEELKSSLDLVHKPLHMDEKHAELLYIKTVVDELQLHQLVIKPFFELGNIQHVESYLNSLPNQQEITSKEQILLEMTKGSVIVAIRDDLLLFDIKKVNTDTLIQTIIEPTIQGPQLSLSEDITTNINIIRQRYHKPSLTVEMMEIGEKTHQSLAIIFDEEVVLKNVLETIYERNYRGIESAYESKKLDTYSKYASKKVEKQITALLTKLQENGADPLGFGVRYKATNLHTRDTYKEWKKIYSEISFDVNVNVSIMSTGIIE
ncbi:hypothetical protein D1953_02830 [Peribacillus asahii]|uniref:Spore germination protein n=1 Tax=Peribacillus asahii TaxID=228899 RepID=A0A398BMS4_9BACI|nr:spore germination protein [Peribacillus asahii]RID88666.1 hypothetical protein D1953_02830 [Peribacillus asahii]